MKRLLLALTILPFAAGVAVAAQPLNDKQMDKVVAGHALSLVETTDVSLIVINVNEPPVTPPAGNTTIGNVILPLTTIQVIWQAIP